MSEAFLNKVYTAQEISESKLIPCKLAERFALKEACMKALGYGIQQGFWFTQIETSNPGHQMWQLSLTGKAAQRKEQMGGAQFSASTSTSQTLAIAVVIAVCT